MNAASLKHAARRAMQTLRAALDWLGARLWPDLTLANEAGDGRFFPDFCRGRAVFGVIAVTELLAIFITLVTRRISENLFWDLLLISIFVQWIALMSVAVLCGARKALNALPPLRAMFMAWALLLLIILVVSELAVWVLWAIGSITSPRPEWYGYFHVQNLVAGAIIAALALRYFLARHQLRQRTLSEARLRVQALRSRIRPHFLFNTMNIIASLIRRAPDKAEAALEDMADLFRTMLTDEENLAPVANEIAVARKYIEIESLRLDERLQVTWDIGKFPRHAVMPVLTLQPLLENAIQHGIEPLATGGTVTVKLHEENERMQISVTSPRLPRRGRASADADEALDNLQLRLAGYYGEAAQLEQKPDRDMLTVIVSLPTRGGKP